MGSTKHTAAGTPLPVGAWYHLVGVREGTRIKLYVNGVLKDTKNVGTGAINKVAARKILIGRMDNGNYLEAEFDEFVVYHRALNDTEVDELYGMKCDDFVSEEEVLAEGGYRYGFNGMEKDDEVSGKGNQYDYGFRMHNPRLGRFISVDPLSISYPMLTPYQFASNMPIWAEDLDGLEALISNMNDNTATFVANVYFVTQGVGSVDESALKKSSESRIVNQLSQQARIIVGTEFKFELNYISVDEKGNSLTYAKAADLAQKSTVTHTTSTGDEIVIQGVQTGVVIRAEKLSADNPDQFVPASINPDGNFNKISLNENIVNQFDQTKAQATFAHELGHYLGRRGQGGTKRDPQKFDHSGGFSGTDPGITSREDKNVRLVPEDLGKMYGGAKLYGKSETIDKK